MIANAAYAGTSEENRQNLDVQVETHIGLNGIGAGVGFFLPDNRRIDLSYSTFRFTFLDSEISQKVYRLELQSFVGNSFYYTLGATHQSFDYRDSDYDWFGDDGYDSTIHSHGENSGLHLAIGNEWQWGHFFLGAEWAGVMVPLTSSYKNTYGSGISEATKAETEKDSKHASSRTTLILLNLFLGFSF